jgi:predicted O-methyltransferase YrrM
MELIYKAPDINGWMNEKALQWLYEKAMEMDSIIEIGCWRGKSTHALLSGCKGTVFAIDHFNGSPDQVDGAHAQALTENIYDSFYKNVGNFKNLVTMRMSSKQAVSFFKDKSVDMVFIDGCHLYDDVLHDILSWERVCKKLLCGHDINENGVPRALAASRIVFKNSIGSIWERIDI